MTLVDVLVPLVIALVVAGVFALVLRRPGPWAEELGWGFGLLMFCALIFLASWGGTIWVGPVGPTVLGVSWLVPLLIALIVAMLLAAAPRGSQARRALQTEERVGVGTAVDSALLVLFGVTAVLLVAVVIVGLL